MLFTFNGWKVNQLKLSHHKTGSKQLLCSLSESRSASFKSILKFNGNQKDRPIALNDIEPANCTLVDETRPVATKDSTSSASSRPALKKKRSVEISTTSSCGGAIGRVSSIRIENNTPSSNCAEHATSQTSVEYKPSKTDHIYSFYLTRLKHSLIISFLLLIPIQNFVLSVISQFSEQVSIRFLETIAIH